MSDRLFFQRQRQMKSYQMKTVRKMFHWRVKEERESEKKMFQQVTVVGSEYNYSHKSNVKIFKIEITKCM